MKAEHAVKIDVHILTRESQEVMRMSTTISGIVLPDGDEDVETLMVAANIPIFGQLNITTSSVPDQPNITWCISEVREDTHTCSSSL